MKLHGNKLKSEKVRRKERYRTWSVRNGVVQPRPMVTVVLFPFRRIHGGVLGLVGAYTFPG
jgi:hypothetical protein